ncbi:CNNM domain-containing protein [Mycoplasmopsis lipofaciens]|uniref:CNNM domain-containing protein n=1 Tax=Mycoplasmopsis lipofaciens TaxID=114884 RepID=UPI000483516F|nr:CNNM domain-containing protein [Mycoplasmopsis lipofaciens]
MDPITILFLIVLFLLLICSAIFSGCETAYTSLNPGKIETLVENKGFGAKIIKKQYSFFNQTLGTILIFNNIVNITSSALISYIFSSSIPELKSYSVLISTLIMTPIIVLFGEIMPKLLAKAHPIWFAQTFCYVLLILYYLLWPITFSIGKIGKKIYITNSEKDVKNLIDVAQNEGVLETNESIMAQNALDLDSIKTARHYIKLKNVSTIKWDANVQEALEVFKNTNYSRLPIDKDGQLIGILHLKDIFFLQNKNKIINYLKVVPSISSNATLASSLEKMRLKRAQMAFVTKNNQSSDVIGILTIEDILEEVVGEIYDEYDDEEIKDIFEISLELFHVSGYVKIKEMIRQLEIELELNQDEKEMTLREWLEKRTEHKITKSTKYQVDDITFRTFWVPDRKNKYYRFEVELGNNADIIDNETTIEKELI